MSQSTQSDADVAAQADAREVARVVAAEDAHVGGLYARLDQLRAQTAEQLAEVRAPRRPAPTRTASSGTRSRRYTRTALPAVVGGEPALLRALDLREGTQDPRRYVGRLGLADERGRGMVTQVSVDWGRRRRRTSTRPPRPLHATSCGRRHLLTSGRRVTGVDDEVLVAADGGGTTGRRRPAGRRHRPPHRRMGDIVATIKAEQDRVIAPPSAASSSCRGAGTGKTAVALHRTAYLLYTHRDRLARSGVMLLGPSPVFLRYVEQVLPASARTGVVTLTLGEMYPGVVGRGEDSPRPPASRGRCGWSRPGGGRGRPPARALRPIRFDLDGTRVQLRPEAIASARTRGPSQPQAHNLARVTFVREVLNSLVNSLARARGVETRRGARRPRRRAAGERRRAPRGNLCWMPLTPQKAGALYRNPALLAEVAPGLSRARPRRPAPRGPDRLDRGRRPAARRARRTPRDAGGDGDGRPAAARSGRSRFAYAPRSWRTSRPPASGTRSSPPSSSPTGSRPAGPAAPSPNALRWTGPGRTGTSSSTRRRNCPRWPGAWWNDAARRGHDARRGRRAGRRTPPVRGPGRRR